MPEGSKRSRSQRRIFKKTPGGRNVLRYAKRKPKKAICSRCGSFLAGVPRERDFKIQAMAKTKKRPSRIYGGMLCSKCSREVLKQKARVSK